LEVTPKNEGGRPTKKPLPGRRRLLKHIGLKHIGKGIDKKLAAQSAKDS
jgi:hypothetical protein